MASPVTSKFFLIKWIYIVTLPNGRRIRNFSASKLFCDFAFKERVGLNDFEDSLKTVTYVNKMGPSLFNLSKKNIICIAK